jgi:hypothetical protein
MLLIILSEQGSHFAASGSIQFILLSAKLDAGCWMLDTGGWVRDVADAVTKTAKVSPVTGIIFCLFSDCKDKF